MKRMAPIVPLCVITFAAGTAFAENEEKVPFTEIRVIQFKERGDDTLHRETPKLFKTRTDTSCSASTAPGPRAAAPLVAAFGGIVLDWMFSRAIGRISEKLKERIREHSTSYSNRLVYGDMFLSSQWTAANETCVVMQRIECQAQTDSVKMGTAKCGDTGRVALSVGVKLRNEGSFLRVLPFALDLQQLKPKHHKGKATVAATFRLEAIGINAADAAGLSWETEDIPVGSLACEVSKDRIPVNSCIQAYALSEELWSRSRAIPMPPKASQAFVFTVGEVGEPSQGLKGFSAFLDATQDDLSGALSEAFQKKIKLSED